MGAGRLGSPGGGNAITTGVWLGGVFAAGVSRAGERVDATSGAVAGPVKSGRSALAGCLPGSCLGIAAGLIGASWGCCTGAGGSGGLAISRTATGSGFLSAGNGVSSCISMIAAIALTATDPPRASKVRACIGRMQPGTQSLTSRSPRTSCMS